MDEDFRPQIIPDPSIVSIQRETQGEVLAAGKYADLYRLVKDEGLPYFARLNGSGEVELFLVFESIDAFSDATRDAVSLEFKTYQNKLLAVIWTLNDPTQPLGFPLNFQIAKAEDRFMALRLLEQAEICLHYLAYEDERITHIFTEKMTLSADEKERVLGYIRFLYDGKTEEHPAEAAEIKEEQIKSMSAVTLPDDVLTREGLAYILHYQAMIEKYGQEGADNLLMSTLQQATLVMRRHARSEVRECSFTIWVAQQEELIYLVVTPALYDLFEVVHSSEEEANPFSRFLLALPEFWKTDEMSPLQLGAYPILRYQSGQLYHLELDEQTGQQLAALFAKRYVGEANPFI